MTDAGGLQLLPSQKKHFGFSFLSGKSILFPVALAFVIVIAIGYMIVRSMISSTMTSLGGFDAKIVAVHADRKKDQEETITNLNKQLSTARTLLKAHVQWSKELQLVQKLIQPRVKFTSLEADPRKRTYRFNARADSYATVARQIAAFYASPAISDVSLSGVKNSGVGAVEFTMQITLTP